MKGIVFKSVVACCMAALAGIAYAQDAAFELPSASSAYIKDYAAFKLAANDMEAPAGKPGSAAPEVKKSQFEPATFSGSNAHKYLGLATLAGVVLTGMAAPDDNECETAPCPPPQPRDTNGTHAKLARATVALAAATVATGLVAHWDDFHFEDGITDPDNLHALLGTAGMLTMAYAVSKAADPYNSNGHAGKAIAGAAMMAVAVKITW
ncbi:MAG: hypothetical protein HZB47_00410 [Nitrosomonadales bacterium]|nr:hypothetical protein [Nitrosomonadales bacterium]